MVEYMTGVDRCVCCGAVIPEGGWVCLNCSRFTVTAGGRRSGKTAISEPPKEVE
jgi:predicted nucleic acid-binding Zn ribbon protein